MDRFNQISWKLDCPHEKATDILNKSLDSPYKPSLFGKSNFKGFVKGNNFKIWSQTPGMRGHRVAICSGQIVSEDKDSSILNAELRISPLLKYISLGWKSLSVLIPLSVIAFVSCIFGVIFVEYSVLERVGFPVGVITIFILLLGFGRYLADHDLIYLRKFLTNLFGKYIIQKDILR